MANTMTLETVRNLQSEIEAALADLSAKYGCTVKLVTANYTETSLVQKLEFCKIGADGKSQNRDMEALKRNLWRLEMTDADVNEVYSHPMLSGGAEFMIVGFRTRARKNPITIKLLDSGKEYVIPLASMKACVAAKKAA